MTDALARAPRLGIVDWGIGGLGLLGLLDELAPALPVVYWSDTGSVPYGMAPTAHLAARLRVVVAELANRGCTEVVLACNAASTVVDRLKGTPIPVAGIIASGMAAVPDAMDGTIGVVAGRRTINGGAYRRGLARPDRQIVSRVAQPLSGHIEAGRTGSPQFAADLRRIVAPLYGAAGVVLACTHYPAVADRFAELLPGTTLIDPAQRMAAELVERLVPQITAAGGALNGDRTILTTGDRELMRSSARLAWGTELPAISAAALDA